MGISQEEIDAEIASLSELRENVSLFKKAFFPKIIAKELDSFLDNYHIYSLYKAIDNSKDSMVDLLEDFRLNSNILLYYYKYIVFIEANIQEEARAAVFVNILLAKNLLATHEYIVAYCVEQRDKSVLANYVSIYGDGDSVISLLAKCLPNLANAELVKSWNICKTLKLEQVEKLLACASFASKFHALLKLEPSLTKNQTCVDSIINSSRPLLTVSLIDQLYTGGYFDEFLTPLVENLLITSQVDTEEGSYQLESMCLGLKFLARTGNPLSEGFKEKLIRYAKIIFNSQTDVLWQYVPLNILEQLYQVIFGICEDEDISMEGLSGLEVKQTFVVSSLLDIEEVLFGREVLLSAKYDDLLYPQACVAFTQMGVCLNDIRSRTKFDSKRCDPLLGFKFLPYLIRANSFDYNCVVLAYCRLPEIRRVLSNAESSVSGISVKDVIRVAKDYNQELYLKLYKINKQESQDVSVSELSFVINSAASHADEGDVSKLRCYTY